MAEVLLSRHAEADLDEIWDYLSERNPQAAFRVLGEINGVFALLAKFPHIGRVREELNGEPRTFPVRRYLILYEVVEEVGVQILRVYHTARNPSRML